MEKNTVWAIALSTIVLVGFMWVQTTYFPTNTATESSTKLETPSTDEKTTETVESSNASLDASIFASADIDDNSDINEQTYTITTDIVKVTFTNRGGDVISYELLNHKDGDTGVQMADNINAQNRAFALSFGEASNSIINDFFKTEILKTTTDETQAIRFSKTFKIKKENNTESTFKLIKIYTFHKGDYLFKLDIHIESEDGFDGLNYNNAAYTLRGSPQIGPYWDKSNDRYESRTFMSYTDNKQKKKSVGDGKTEIYDKAFTWTGIADKYFVELIVPTDTSVISNATYSSAIEVDDYANSQIKVTRNPINNTSSIVDTYYVYVGPRTEATLKTYNISMNNSWDLEGLHLDESLRSSGILSWLETILKWIMQLFYFVIPNWGVSIILMTIAFRIIMFPLTKKQSEGTVKMQELQPQMKVLQDKYKDNPQKLNVELGKFYKETGYNPMSGCLPLLIQFPIIIAMYNLFNNYFEFRGALFIPGWIPDLSLPDIITTFNFSIPFLGNQLHVLPLLYVFTQILSMKFTQTQTTGSSASSMKIMMYGMPIFFFFIFYNAPSGLLIYWILSNALMTIQQAIINGYVHGKEKKDIVVVPKKEVRLPPSAKKKFGLDKKTASKNKNRK